MRCGSPLSVPSRLSNRDIPSYQSPRLPYRFSRAAASENPIRFAVPRPYSAWRDATPPSFSPRSPHDWRGGSAPAPLPAPLSVQSASRLSPRLAFRSAARCLPYYPLSYTAGGANVCFSRTYSFSSSISTRHVIHFSIYMRAWWNGRHARFRFWWRNPCGFESHRPHHGNA